MARTPPPTYFETPTALRDWFAANHDTASELWVGFRKKSSGLPSITWPEAVDEALCVGWIDSVRYSVDHESYTNRFTPRQPRSTWSAVNIARVRELIAAGRMLPAGLAAFDARADERSAIYAYEQRHAATLDAEEEAAFRANADAWSWFESRPPSYRRTATHWVISAKKPETRAKRLATLVADSAAGRPIGPLTPRKAPRPPRR